ncbi:hypothetical protein VHUM_02932 [Vanrija humicola]|uniref:AB hydrolase-1 domain-containing protein n=1 Tax=Vanrija humicola TaxID=5417 RepID=A0A7D8Z2J9_VANHU|nr:hypothetical protein VHUM_02932 [Vanrija humicola]
MITVRITTNGVDVALHARISVPGNPLATAIEPRLPTILFCHPTWLDSFFFYPQIEDPLFAQHYNLVAFDLRGHGSTQVVARDESYSIDTAAEDVAAGLDALGVKDVHVVGVGVGALVAAALAAARPALVQGLVLIALPPARDDEQTALGFRECEESLVHAVTKRDLELLDMITTATFEYDAGALPRAVLEIRDEYVALARAHFANATAQEAADAAWYIWHPVRARIPPTPEVLGRIKAPVLVLQGVGSSDSFTEDAENWCAEFNFAQVSRGHSARANVTPIQHVDHYMTLTSPNMRSGQARRPSTPRGLSFDIPPPPRVIPGMRTIGDELDRLAVDTIVTRVSD